MNVSLTPELEGFVQRLVESGLYGSASEVVRDGLRLLAEREGLKDARLEELRKEIARGLSSAEAGRLKDGSATLREIGNVVRKRGKKRA
jgi:antitoxin ParD1/3/4